MTPQEEKREKIIQLIRQLDEDTDYKHESELCDICDTLDNIDL